MHPTTSSAPIAPSGTDATVGIDVSKHQLDVVIRWSQDASIHQQFDYTASGQKAICQWLADHQVLGASVCLEATGRYSMAIATTLHEAGYRVSVEPPFRTHHFAKSLMKRQKTDKVDAEILAHYAAVMTPDTWQPPTLMQQDIRDLKRLIDDIDQDRTRTLNRLEGLRANSAARPHLEQQLADLEKRLQQVQQELADLMDADMTYQAQIALLTSIKGIGDTTARALLAELPDLMHFTSSDEVVAFAGLSPQQVQSGQKTGYSRISKRGNGHIRKTLYYPALTAMQYNPHLKVFAERLKAKGKPKMVVVVAVMRKLLVLAYAILKSGQPYDPNYQFSS